MKLFLAKAWQFVWGYDYRRWFPEKWDLSEVYVWEEYGGNDLFVYYYNSPYHLQAFVHGIDIKFYGDSFKIKSIVGYTRTGVCSIAVNKKSLGARRS